MKIDIEKITVTAKSRALKATWTFEPEPSPPPRKHYDVVSPWLQYDVMLDWDDNEVRHAADQIQEWLEDRFKGARQAYYFKGVKKDNFEGMFWYFKFAQENDAIEFKLRWA